MLAGAAFLPASVLSSTLNGGFMMKKQICFIFCCLLLSCIPCNALSPDLLPAQSDSPVRINRATILQGNAFILSPWLLRNDGDSNVTQFEVGVYINPVPVRLSDGRELFRLNSEKLVFNYSIERIEAHQTILQPARSITVPVDIRPGDYRVYIRVDNRGSIQESNENNNILLLEQILEITAPIEADLSFLLPEIHPFIRLYNQKVIVADPFASQTVENSNEPVVVAPRGNVYLANGIVNNGDIRTGEFSVGYYISVDPNIGNNARRIGGDRIESLEPRGFMVTPTTKFRLPDDIAPGNYYFCIFIDEFNQVGELFGEKETNNIRVRPIRVLDCPSDDEEILQIRISLKTASGSHDDTDEPVFVNLGDDDNRIYLDKVGDDFEKGKTGSYNLVLSNVRALRNISRIVIGKEGHEDDWRLSEISLEVNGINIYRSIFRPTILINEPNQRNSRISYVSIGYTQLRTNASWRAWKESYYRNGYNLSFKISLLEITRAECIEIIEAIGGHQLKIVNDEIEDEFSSPHLKWKSATDPIKLSKIDDNTMSVAFSLVAELNNLPDAILKLSFNLNIVSTCDDIKIEASDFNIDVESWPGFESIYQWIIGDLINKIAENFSTAIPIDQSGFDLYKPYLITIDRNCNIKVNPIPPGLDEYRFSVRLAVEDSPFFAFQHAVRPGENLPLTIIVNNLSGRISPEYQAEVYLIAASDSQDSTVLIAKIDRPQLQVCPDNEDKWIFNWNVPGNIACGRYVLQVKIKLRDKELICNNPVIRVIIGNCDLEVLPITTNRENNTFSAGSSIKIKSYIRNIGIFESTGIRYAFYLSKSPSGINPVYVTIKEAPPLKPNKTYECPDLSFVLPPGTPVGQYFIGVRAEQNGETSSECNTDNNTSYLKIIIN